MAGDKHRWLTAEEAADMLSLKRHTVAVAIRTAAAEGRKAIFDGIRIQNFGSGKQRGRWRVWSGDIAPKGAARA